MASLRLTFQGAGTLTTWTEQDQTRLRLTKSTRLQWRSSSLFLDLHQLPTPCIHTSVRPGHHAR